MTPEEIDSGLTRAADQTIGQPTPGEKAALDARLREFEGMRRRGEATALTTFVGLAEGVYDGANRYDTDDEHVLHLWRDGQSYDVIAPRVTPGGVAGLLAMAATVEIVADELGHTPISDTVDDEDVNLCGECGEEWPCSRVTSVVFRLDLAGLLSSPAQTPEPVRALLAEWEARYPADVQPPDLRGEGVQTAARQLRQALAASPAQTDGEREWRVVVVRKDGQRIVTQAHGEDDLQRRLDSVATSPVVESFHGEYRIVGPWSPVPSSETETPG